MSILQTSRFCYPNHKMLWIQPSGSKNGDGAHSKTGFVLRTSVQANDYCHFVFPPGLVTTSLELISMEYASLSSIIILCFYKSCMMGHLIFQHFDRDLDEINQINQHESYLIRWSFFEVLRRKPVDSWWSQLLKNWTGFCSTLSRCSSCQIASTSKIGGLNQSS